MYYKGYKLLFSSVLLLKISLKYQNKNPKPQQDFNKQKVQILELKETWKIIYIYSLNFQMKYSIE